MSLDESGGLLDSESSDESLPDPESSDWRTPRTMMMNESRNEDESD
jgi:hypothetical protein